MLDTFKFKAKNAKHSRQNTSCHRQWFYGLKEALDHAFTNFPKHN